jgi:hypothetical protein
VLGELGLGVLGELDGLGVLGELGLGMLGELGGLGMLGELGLGMLGVGMLGGGGELLLDEQPTSSNVRLPAIMLVNCRLTLRNTGDSSIHGRRRLIRPMLPMPT